MSRWCIQKKLGQEVLTAKSIVDKVTPQHLACLEGHVDVLGEILARIPRITDALLPMDRDVLRRQWSSGRGICGDSASVEMHGTPYICSA